MEPVHGSSRVSEIGYDRLEKTLYVRFRSGSEYRYHEVPQVLYDESRQSASVGRFLYQNVTGVYPQTKA
jgi:hypothetical protein